MPENMADTLRWRAGETNRIMAPVDADVAIELGDLCYWDDDDAKPASSQPDQGDESANQALFLLNFLGVALAAKPAGSGGTIPFAADGDFAFDVPSGTYELGQALAPAENAGGTALENQTLTTPDYPEHAIAHVTQRATVATTAVIARIRSTLLYPLTPTP